ncbi:MAG: CBS domain-containing protein, partial [bacterium]
IQDPVTVPPGLSIQELIDDYLLSRGYRSYPVVEDSRVLGVISIDLIRDVGVDERRDRTVGDCMTPVSEETRVAPDTPLSIALKKLSKAPNGRLIVQREDGTLRGMLTKEGLSRFLEIRRVLEESGGEATSAESGGEDRRGREAA